jgi:acyl-CoA thioester hydrolase
MVHAARYHEFFEDAFLDWLDLHAGGYRQLRDQTGVDLVIVTSGCEYRAPGGAVSRRTEVRSAAAPSP